MSCHEYPIKFRIALVCLVQQRLEQMTSISGSDVVNPREMVHRIPILLCFGGTDGALNSVAESPAKEVQVAIDTVGKVVAASSGLYELKALRAVCFNGNRSNVLSPLILRC